MLANPWVVERDGEQPPPAAIRARYAERLRSPREWARLLRGGVDLGKLARGLRSIAAPTPAADLAARFAAALAGRDAKDRAGARRCDGDRLCGCGQGAGRFGAGDVGGDRFAQLRAGGGYGSGRSGDRQGAAPIAAPSLPRRRLGPSPFDRSDAAASVGALRRDWAPAFAGEAWHSPERYSAASTNS